ncbi:MAG: beta-eliminating lyase-related protein [Chloroflexota bacterium]
MTYDIQEIAKSCQHFLPGRGPIKTMAQTFQELADSLNGDEIADRYGSGDYLQAFEAEIAEMFGKEAAVFMPSGTMAQQIAMRIWCEKRSNYTVAMHPRSHLETAEHAGYLFLHNIHRLQFGGPEFVGDRMLTVEDFENLGKEPGAALIELPYRELGGPLPTWDEIQAIQAWCAEQGVPLHMDGARVWQCRPFYQKSYQDIASLFDSVYVSFYKDIGGLSGSMLLGSADFIAEAKVWQRRYGGNLFTLAPFVAAAKAGVEQVVPQIDSWVERAQAVVEIFNQFDEISTYPNPPHTNFFRLYIRGDHKELTEKHHQLAQETGVILFWGLHPAAVPDIATTEIHCWQNAMNFDLDQMAPFLKKLLS